MSYKKIILVATIVIMMSNLVVGADVADAANVDNVSIIPEQVLKNAEIIKVDLNDAYASTQFDDEMLLAEEHEQVLEVYTVSSDNSRSSSSSGSSKYYYNIGEYCPDYVTYNKYNLLSVVKKGDIIYEANGGFGITGHIAIVEGMFYRFNGTPYIRLIEAIDVGVVRSLLDDTRFDDKAVTVLRVSGATSEMIDDAVAFCKGELGSSYALDLAKDASSSETNWYCSELVWAAYYNQGINVEVSSLGEPGITPHDILNSSKTYTINVSKRA